MNYHLVILKKPYLQAVLDGSKTVESRLTRTRRSYFGRVFPGDRLFLKVSAGPVSGIATAAAVKYFTNLTAARIDRLRQTYNHLIKANIDYWQSKRDCRFGMLVWLEDVGVIEPFRINKKDWRSWVVLTPQENYGLAGPAVLGEGGQFQSPG